MRGGFSGPRRRNNLSASSAKPAIPAESAAQISETAVMIAALPDVLPN